MKTLCRTIHPEVRIIDAAKGIVDYVASDESIDSYREVIRADGWRFNRFRRNAPFVNSHDYSTIGNLVGKVTEFRVERNAEGRSELVERVQWAIDVPDHQLAHLGWKLTEAGYLKAVSVGFFPIKSVHKWQSEKGPFEAAVAELGLPLEEALKVCCVYLEQEQIELSACIIGANQNALAKAYKAGAIGDEDLEIIEALATHKDFRTTPPNTDSPADDRADAGESRRLDREAWLREFTNQLNS